jgi:hypothetical protein
MTAVRRRACREPGKVIVHFDVRPPADVMAITSLPRALGRWRSPAPTWRSPCGERGDPARTARGAAPTSSH